MGFLDALRGSNIFARKPETERPFGMPEIDDGNVNRMFGNLIRLSKGVNRDNDTRERQMMKFEHSLREPKPPPMDMRQRAYGGGRPLMSGSIAGPSSPGGNFSPMQRMFQARDQDDREAKLRSEMLEQSQQGKLAETVQAGNIRNSGEMERLIAELNTRREMGTEDRGSRERVADKQIQAKNAADAIERNARSSEGNLDRQSREKIATLPPRTIPNPQDEFAAKVQNFKIQHPDLADRVVYDEASKSYKLNTQGMTPEQLVAIQTRLGGSQPARKSVAPTKRKVSAAAVK